MKSTKFKSLFLLILFLSLINFIFGEILDLNAVNSEGAVVFRVLDGANIYLPNHWRPKESLLKFSFLGAKIVEVKYINNQIWELKLSDNSLATIGYVNKTLERATEFNFNWIGGGQNEKREVCFHYGLNEASWYNTYQSLNHEWPLNPAKTHPKTDFNSLTNHDWALNPGEYFFILEHLFLNSDGFGLLLDEFQPWFIQRTSIQDDPQICFSVNGSDPYSTSISDPSFKDIKFQLFTSENMRNLTDFIVHKSGFIPKPTKMPEKSFFSRPIFRVMSNSESELLGYTDKLKRDSLTPALISDVTWKGQYQFYPTLESIITQLKSKDIDYSLEVLPNHQTSHEEIKKLSLIDRKSGKIKEVFDLTNEDAIDYLQTIWKKFKLETGVRYLTLEYTRIDNFTAKSEREPNLFIKNYIRASSELMNVSSWLGFKSQDLPIVTQLLNHQLEEKKTFLERVIPNILSVSIGGYSFIAGSPIGRKFGGEELSEELFIRWLQINTLLPVLLLDEKDFNWEKSQLTLKMVKKFVALHQEFSETIIYLVKERLERGSPIIRPLWYLEPDNPITYKINDQYMLGDDILVAPIVEIGKRERMVYFPIGIWLDQHGKEYIGPGTSLVGAPLEELPYFKRKLEA